MKDKNMIAQLFSKHHLKHTFPLSFGEGLGVRLLFFFSILLLVSCTTEESEDVNDINKQTVLVFMPWSGTQTSQGLYRYFQQNLDSIESAIRARNSSTSDGRVLVFLSTSANESSLYEITYENRQIQHTTLQTYSGNLYTTAEGITQILNDVKADAFALNYAMIIGCHGSGWTFKDDWENYPNYSKLHPFTIQSSNAKGKNAFGKATSTFEINNSAVGNGPYPTTRFYGSVGDKNYATDITTLAEGIKNAGIKMQYILFDDCYMANVETAYELKDATNFLIGSTSEVMAIGMPYQTMWSSLASSTPSYANAVNAFNTYYKNYDYPYGTISAIDCRKLDRLAEQMRMINQNYTLADSLVDSLQVLDGFSTPIFYDMGDYVAHLCKNNDILNDFNATLTQAVKASAHTDSVYSYLYSAPKYIKVNRFSGLTISNPSRNSVAIKGKEKTAWWKATH